MDIYVGNLPYEVTDDELRGHFEQFGQVASARVVMDKITGRAKGFGFVEMADRNEALKAIESTNGKDFKGRPLRVNESQPKPRSDGPRGGHGGGHGGHGGGYGGGKRW
jgi:RNA recognition motif-containing protein